MKQRYLVLTICLTAVALFGLYIGSRVVRVWTDHEDGADDAGHDLASLTPEPATSAQHRASGSKARAELPAGTVLSYDLSYGGQIGAQQYLLTGNFELAVLTATHPQIAWVRITAANAPDALVPILAHLGRGTYVQLAADGFGFTVPDAATIAKLDLPPDHQSAAQKEFWHALGERLTVRYPVGDREQYATEDEAQDATKESKSGITVEAKYKFDGRCGGASPSSFAFEKNWHGRAADAGRAVSGEAKGEFRPHCRGLSRLNFRETETITAAAERLVGITELNLRLEDAAQKTVASVNKDYLHLASTDQGASDYAPATENAIDSAQVGDLDESQLLASLRQYGGREQMTQEQYLQLKSWIALHPDSITRIRLAMADYPVDDPRVRAFVKALGAVGSESAQDTLVAMAKDHAGDPDFAARIVTTLGFVSSPSIGATKALVSYAETSSDKALVQRAKLASGIMGSRLRQSTSATDQSRALDLETTIDGWLDKAQTDSERYDALAALGNLGPRNLSPIMKLISDQSSTAIIDEAYFALRFAPDAAVVDFLQRSFVMASGSNAANVRSAVVRTLAARPVDDTWYRVVLELADHPDHAHAARPVLAPGDTLALAQAVVRSHDSGNREQAKAVLDRLTQRASDPATLDQLTELRRSLSH